MTEFPDAARRYCAFIQRAGDLPLEDRLVEARRELVALYAAALTLPGDLVDDDCLGRRPERPANWKDVETKDFYIEIFDVHGDDNRPVGSSVADDLIEIYDDIGDGLSLWHGGHHGRAIWEWRFAFDSHWGRHAVSAIKALHNTLRR